VKKSAMLSRPATCSTWNCLRWMRSCSQWKRSHVDALRQVRRDRPVRQAHGDLVVTDEEGGGLRVPQVVEDRALVQASAKREAYSASCTEEQTTGMLLVWQDTSPLMKARGRGGRPVRGTRVRWWNEPAWAREIGGIGYREQTRPCQTHERQFYLGDGLRRSQGGAPTFSGAERRSGLLAREGTGCMEDP
jgi:hypothetical protein